MEKDKLEELLDMVYEYAREEGNDFLKVKKLTDDIQQVARSGYIARDDYVEKEYIPYGMASDCYKEVLDTDDHYNEILLRLAKEAGYTEEWLREVKQNNFLHSKQVVESFDKHPVQIDMKEKNIMHPPSLKRSRSVTNLVKQLYDNKVLYDKFNEILAKNSELENRVDDLSIEVDGNVFEIDRIKETLSMMPTDQKEKAVFLRERGYKYDQIAKMLGKGSRTIKRWVKES